MTTINLYQNPDDQNKGISFGNGGFWLSVSILALTILGVLGLKMYVKNIISKNDKIGEVIINENKSLAGVDSLQRVLDMQARITEINKNLQIQDKKVGKLQITKVLDNLEKEMNSGVALKAYDYSGESGKVDVTFETSNFNDSARQLLNLKKSDYFTDVKLSSLNRAEKNIETKISMQIKESAK